MITIINNILSSAGYKEVAIDLSIESYIACLFCPADSSSREEYFVTIQLAIQSDESAQDFLNELAQDLFDRICGSGKVDPSFEKNCTILICQREDGISISTIMMIEEDQYNFKKNVIAYDQKELSDLKNYLVQENIESVTNDVINSIINADSGKKFLDFKNSHKKEKDHYSLTLKIVLKVPFITYYPQEQKLISLDQEIEKSLSQYQSSIYGKVIASDTDWDDENAIQKVESIWGARYD